MNSTPTFARTERPSVVDVRGACCDGALDPGGLCCPSGRFDACGACDGDGTSCPVWLELRLWSLPSALVAGGSDAAALNAHLTTWAALALGLDESSVAGSSAGGQLASRVYAPPPPPPSRRRLLQTSDYPVSIVVPARPPFAAGVDPAATVMAAVERVGVYGGRVAATQVTTNASISDDLWNTRASRVLGIARAGACGNGVCETGEACVGDAEASAAPNALTDAAVASYDRTEAYGSWTASLNDAKAAVEGGYGLPGPTTATAAATCCPADCPVVVKTCPSPENTTTLCGGRGRCLIATGQCDCFPGRGWTGVACGECAEGHYYLRGECMRRIYASHPPPPAAPAVFLAPPPPPAPKEKVTWEVLIAAIIGAMIAAALLYCCGAACGLFTSCVSKKNKTGEKYNYEEDDNDVDAGTLGKKGKGGARGERENKNASARGAGKSPGPGAIKSAWGLAIDGASKQKRASHQTQTRSPGSPSAKPRASFHAAANAFAGPGRFSSLDDAAVAHGDDDAAVAHGGGGGGGGANRARGRWHAVRGTVRASDALRALAAGPGEPRKLPGTVRPDALKADAAAALTAFGAPASSLSNDDDAAIDSAANMGLVDARARSSAAGADPVTGIATNAFTRGLAPGAVAASAKTRAEAVPVAVSMRVPQRLAGLGIEDVGSDLPGLPGAGPSKIAVNPGRWPQGATMEQTRARREAAAAKKEAKRRREEARRAAAAFEHDEENPPLPGGLFSSVE